MIRGESKIGLALLGFFFALSPVYGSFITNGGFETGSFAGWIVSGPYACVSASVACVGAFGLDSDPGPDSGSYAAYLGGSAPDDLLSQTLATPAGQQLTLSFYLAAPTYLGLGTPNYFDISWDGSAVASLANLTNTGYVQFSYTVTGTGSDTLQFDSNNTNSAFVLDDVSVTATPEPATFVPVCLGLAAVCLSARNRRVRA
jgi:hypothetical protein